MTKNTANPAEASIIGFINNIDTKVKRSNSLKLLDIFKSINGYELRMWNLSIIGFGTCHFIYKTNSAITPDSDYLNTGMISHLRK